MRRVSGQRWSSARPQILGAFLDYRQPGAQDSAQRSSSPACRGWPILRSGAVLCAPACGWSAAAIFSTPITTVRASTHTLTLEASLLWPPLSELLIKPSTWDGTPRELLAALSTRVDEDIRKQREWPKKPNVLSNQLRRLIPTLKEVKIAVKFYRDDDLRAEPPHRNCVVSLDWLCKNIVQDRPDKVLCGIRSSRGSSRASSRHRPE